MHFSIPTTFALLVSLAIASPLSLTGEKNQRATKAAASVLTVQTYNDFQVSDGQAGNALAEVNASFPVSVYLFFPLQISQIGGWKVRNSNVKYRSIRPTLPASQSQI